MGNAPYIAILIFQPSFHIYYLCYYIMCMADRLPGAWHRVLPQDHVWQNSMSGLGYIQHFHNNEILIFQPSIQISLQRLGAALRNFAGVFRSLIRLHLAKKNERKQMGNAPYIAIEVVVLSCVVRHNRCILASQQVYSTCWCHPYPSNCIKDLLVT